MKSNRKSQRGFVLIELLAIVPIIGLLFGGMFLGAKPPTPEQPQTAQVEVVNR